MNYFAHLYLAQPTSDSFLGNLLGDFRKGTNVTTYPIAVQAGLKNHIMVDNYTDNHRLIKDAKKLFSRETRRFSGVALDVLFDHYLINDWQQYHTTDFEVFKRDCYRLLASRLGVMPEPMHRVMTSVIERDWFAHYATQAGTLQAIENIAKRIRFPNRFASISEEVAYNDKELKQRFREFFPQLVEEVHRQGIETTQSG